MPEKDIGAKCRDRAVQVERLAKPLDAAGEGAKVLEGAGGSLGTVRKTSPGQPCRWKGHCGSWKSHSTLQCLRDSACLRKTLEQSAGTEPCKEGCEGFEGAELHTQGLPLRGRGRRFWRGQAAVLEP